MKTYKRVLTGMAIVIGALGFSMAVAAPASAAPVSAPVTVASVTADVASPNAATNCPSGATCIWGNTGYTTTSYGCSGGGDWVGFQNSISDFTTYYFCVEANGSYYSANDRAASSYNRGTQCSSGLYKDAGFGSIAVSMARGTGYTNLAGSGKRTDLSSGQFIC